MATSRLFYKPPVGCSTQRFCSLSYSYARKSTPNSSRKDISSSSGSNNSNLKGEMGITRAKAGVRNMLLRGKVATQAIVSQPVTGQGFDTLWESVMGVVSSIALGAAKWKLDPSQAQGFLERVIVDCRFFTLLGIAGSLLGSILCFVEGFTMVLHSYFHYFEAVLHKMDHGSMVQLLIEAIDTFLVGTAMLTFGMALYVMFVGSKHKNQSNVLGLFYLEKLQSWLKMESVAEAKARVGHAVLLILQVGMLDNFKSVPLLTGSDLASFAGAVLLSSASIFCLSKLSSSQIQ